MSKNKTWQEKLIYLCTVAQSIHTDSDLEDFAKENHVSEKDVFHFVASMNAENTPCEGCKYIDFYPNMAPCSRCSRSYNIKDHFTRKE